MFAQIKTWGNSQGIWLSQGLPDSIGVHVNDVLKIKHKTLEERAVEFDGKVGPYEEYDWGKPQGKELW